MSRVTGGYWLDHQQPGRHRHPLRHRSHRTPSRLAHISEMPVWLTIVRVAAAQTPLRTPRTREDCRPPAGGSGRSALAWTTGAFLPPSPRPARDFMHARPRDAKVCVSVCQCVCVSVSRSISLSRCPAEGRTAQPGAGRADQPPLQPLRHLRAADLQQAAGPAGAYDALRAFGSIFPGSLVFSSHGS